MKPAPPVRHLIELTPGLIHANDDAPTPGRTLVVGACELCRRRHRFALPAGRWRLSHTHGHGWTVAPATGAATAA